LREDAINKATLVIRKLSLQLKEKENEIFVLKSTNNKLEKSIILLKEELYK
jgi:hypothetical protein